MIDFTVHTQIARTPAEVFAYVADPSKLATWQTNTVVAELLGDGPMGVGTRLREVHRAPGGRELESVVEVSDVRARARVRPAHGRGHLPLDAHLTFAPADARHAASRSASPGSSTGARAARAAAAAGRAEASVQRVLRNAEARPRGGRGRGLSRASPRRRPTAASSSTGAPSLSGITSTM